MEHVNALASLLNATLNWNSARAKFLAQVIIAMIQTKTSNLSQLALGMASRAMVSSRYRRIQRFLHQFEFDQGVIFSLISKMFPLPRKLTLVMDRTNWQFGRAHLNFLVLSIACRGIAIPVYWVNLSHAGNSCTRERINALKRVIALIGKQHRIRYLLADREFVGTSWFDWLITSGTRFVIRVKKNTLVYHKRQKCPVPLGSLFRNLTRIFHKPK